MKRVCQNCPSYLKIAENTGLCNKYGFQIHVSLAKKDRVCEGMEIETETRKT